MTTNGTIVVERASRVLIVRLDDPATMNALSVETITGLHDAIRDVPAEVGAVVLAGHGRAFCSGANLAGTAGAVDLGDAVEHAINPLMLALRDLPVPLITAVRGAAAGLGASLALIGDLVVAGRSAYFMQSFARIGLVPDGGSAWLLARTVGRLRAMEMMLLGDRLPAATAFEWGMVSRLVDDEAVLPTALELAARLAAGPRFALGLIREAAWAGADGGFSDQLALEARLQSRAGAHPDFAEGVAAFLERRPARFERD